MGKLLLSLAGLLIFSTGLTSFNNIPSSGVSGHSDRYTISNPLTVEFLGFKAKRVSDGAYLDWITENEIGNKHFLIQRSADTSNFHTIGTVLAQTGGNGRYYYHFIDFDLPVGTSYYRLQQVDMNNNFSYSRILSMRKSSPIDISLDVYPNPSTGSVTLHIAELAGKFVDLELNDAKGSLLQKMNIHLDESGRYGLKTPLSRGMYFLRIICEERTYSQVFLTQ